MRNIGFKLLTGVALAALLAGCATTEAELHTRENARIAGDLRSVSETPAAPMNVSPVQVKPANYVGAEVSRNLHGDPLPTKWQRENVQVAKASNAGFQDVADAIFKATGIPVAVSTAGIEQRASSSIPQMAGSADATSFNQVPGIASGPMPEGFPLGDALATISAAPGVATATVPSVGDRSLGIDGSMRLNYSGKLSGLLDLVASNFNVNWEYRGGRIVFSRTITQAFNVPALPIMAQLRFNMDSGATSGSGGATASGAQSASTETGYDIWQDLDNAIKSMVGSTGVYQMSAQTGQIVVTAPPATMTRVSDYVKQLNSHLNKQVAISVKVFSVQMGDNDRYDSRLQALLGPLDFTGATGGAGVGWAILDQGRSASGSLSMLSGRTDVSTVTSASVTALNGVPVPVQVANTRGYAERVDVTVGDNGTTSSITPGTVTTGFNLHLVPKILDNGDLLLQYGMNISELVGADNGFDVFTSNGSSVQLPNINQRNFIQQARIPNGSTLVLAGFEQVRANSSKQGPGHGGLWPFGGSRNSSMNREVMVIAITPVVLDLSPAAMAAYAQ